MTVEGIPSVGVWFIHLQGEMTLGIRTFPIVALPYGSLSPLQYSLPTSLAALPGITLLPFFSPGGVYLV